jgi:hypothetical protein
VYKEWHGVSILIPGFVFGVLFIYFFLDSKKEAVRMGSSYRCDTPLGKVKFFI